ncbi:MAG TPA: nuclear transport factor 2 family protein [Mycobacteriales bacterium]|nr:nuclear transport factor 2 family protein [Mycobacteriales bacterium]
MTTNDVDAVVRASDVLHRYCAAIDSHDAEALAKVFSPDVVLAVAGAEGSAEEQTFPGRDTVVAILASLFEQRQWARHLVSNVRVAAQADGSLDVRSYFQFHLGRADGVTSGVGDYRVLMRDDDGRLVISRFTAAIVHEVTA